MLCRCLSKVHFSRSVIAPTAVSSKSQQSKVAQAKKRKVRRPKRIKQGMRVAVEGCCHGELDKIYATMQELERQQDKKIDLLICCGDFQAVRNLDDLQCLACPDKYRDIQTFYKYYTGEAVAPYPTLFIGGNHEAANHLWELYYGGWAAPKIYYLGHAGVVRFGGVRIGGLSGIYNARHYRQGHFERPPYTDSTMRSAYHIRELEVYRLLQLRQPLDIMLSHDWPHGIAHHGPLRQLLRTKPFLQGDIESGRLGSPPGMQIMRELCPRYWFAAHHHVKFPAVVRHQPRQGATANGGQSVEDLADQFTSFLALDKCLPGRKFLQVLDFPDANGPREFSYDPEWLAILKSTHQLLNLTNSPRPLPGMGGSRAEVTQEALEFVKEALQTRGGARIPHNFVQTAPGHTVTTHRRRGQMPTTLPRNPQTVALLEMLGLPYNLDPATASQNPPDCVQPAPNPEEINLDEGVENPEEIDLDDTVEDPEELDLDAQPEFASGHLVSVDGAVH